MNKKHIMLNPKYPNEFLTTQPGPTFYQKGNMLGKAHNSHEIDLEDDNNLEIKRLVEQGILRVIEEPVNAKPLIVKDKPPILSRQEEVKEDMIITDTPGDTIREVKTEENNQLLDETKENLLKMAEDSTTDDIDDDQ